MGRSWTRTQRRWPPAPSQASSLQSPQPSSGVCECSLWQLVSSGLNDTSCIRGYGLKLQRTHLPAGNLISLHRHSCFQRSSTPTSLLKHACNPTAFTFLCIRKSNVTSDSSRCGGLPEITLWVSGSPLQRKAQDRGQWQSWQSFKDSSLLSRPPHLAVSSVPSHLDLDQGRKFISKPTHQINLLWHMIFQAASVSDPKLGQN